MRWISLGLFCLALLSLSSAASATIRDGHRFDPAVSMEAPADGAPPETAQLLSLLGHWDLSITTFGEEEVTTQGAANITLMNRGHGYFQRLRDPESNTDIIAFIVFNPAASRWVLGVADSSTESITLYDGTLDQNRLVLRNEVRRGAGAVVTYERVTLSLGDESMEQLFETSSDRGENWAPTRRVAYVRRDDPSEVLTREGGYGSAPPELVPEATAFDFLVGEWSENHWMNLNGNEVQFPVNGTAVHALNGRAIMEFAWYDVDPNLPDAAVTIVRLYNRAMRRWECMYSTNRFNSILYFGGVEEDDRIVLHGFESHMGTGPVNYWTFHDRKDDSYGWFANTSRDGGNTFEKTWIISATRKEPTVGR